MVQSYRIDGRWYYKLIALVDLNEQKIIAADSFINQDRFTEEDLLGSYSWWLQKKIP